MYTNLIYNATFLSALRIYHIVFIKIVQIITIHNIILVYYINNDSSN